MIPKLTSIRITPVSLFVVSLCFAGSMASIVCHAHDENIASLMQQLEHADVDVRNSARDALEEIGEAAVPALIVMGLNHDNAVVRQHAVSVLSRMVFKNERLIRDLSKLKDPNSYDTPHDDAIVSRNEDITSALVKALKDDDYEVRSKAVNHFLSFSVYSKELAPEVVSGLIHSLCYGSPFFRACLKKKKVV